MARRRAIASASGDDDMTINRKRKFAFVLLAITALAAVPCAWDASDIRDASWLPAVLATLASPQR